ncbi:hypothetical protein [Streptomyces exfoliatus]|uniref:hypothetical protein n=1 Tax=Streptomyces exfoliatus TaxID=1905 RepID=UPI0012FF5778|nr:hypothetical protein [Streptomyces exfoliatus]
MSTQRWELRAEGSTIGVLHLLEIDQPWFRCEFAESHGWQRVRDLFEAQAEAVDSGDQERMMQAIGAVRSLQLELYSADSGETIEPVMIQIRDDRANFRY